MFQQAPHGLIRLVSISTTLLHSTPPLCSYANMFLDNGGALTWFAQPLQKPETPVIVRLLHAGAATAAAQGIDVSGWPATSQDAAKTVDRDSAAASAAQPPSPAEVLLFCRLPDEPYLCCGRLALRAVDLAARPLRFLWQLCDAPVLRETEAFTAMTRG